MEAPRRVRAGLIVQARVADKPLLAAAALAFVASAALTIGWCASMSAMPGMDMPGGWTMSMAWMRMQGQGWPGAAASFLGMWIAMMVAMMLPVLVPMLLAFRETLPAMPSSRRCRLTVLVAAGYFGVWLLMGIAIFPAGVALADLAMSHGTVARHAPAGGACALLLAGVIQAGPWKRRELATCRWCVAAGAAVSPTSAWRHGISLGWRCVRCCAPWTTVLLVWGVMDLAAMALVTTVIGLERLLPRGEQIARAAGIALLFVGVVALTIA